MTQTEQLRKRIGKIISWMIMDRVTGKDGIDLILLACKEEGLKFVYYIPDPQGMTGSITQIKEIEIE